MTIVDANRPAAKRFDRRSLLPWITTPLLVALLIAVWQAYVQGSQISAFILPTPGAVWSAWLDLLASPRAWGHAATTVYETVIGFAWGLVIGVGLGVLIGRIAWLERTLNPFIVAIQVVPKVAFVPLFVVWFGFGIFPKVICAFMLGFFPVVVSTVMGFKSVEPDMIDLARSMKASRLATFMRISLPQALPSIFAGLKVSVTLAVVGAVVGEFVGSNSGIGYLLQIANGNFDLPLMFAALTVLSLVGVTLFAAVDLVERLMIPWHASQRNDFSATA